MTTAISLITTMECSCWAFCHLILTIWYICGSLYYSRKRRNVEEDSGIMRTKNARAITKRFGNMALYKVSMLFNSLLRFCKWFFVRAYFTGRCRRQLSMNANAQLVWFWCYGKMNIESVGNISNLFLIYLTKCWLVSCSATACFNRCRAVCTSAESALLKMAGTKANPIQSDELYFAGKQKHNRVRLAQGDRRHSEEQEPREGFRLEVLSSVSVEPREEEYSNNWTLERTIQRTNH